MIILNAKAITHEYRHLFQIVYSYYYDDEIATNWKEHFKP